MPQNVALIGDVEVSFEDAMQALKELPETLDSLGSAGARLESRAREFLDDFREFVRGDRSVPTSSTVILYRHSGGRGAARGFNTGDAISRLSDIHWRVHALRWEDWNDVPSSLKVEGGVALIAYEHSNYGGAHLLVVGPAYVDNLGSKGWNDKMSSLKVMPADRDVIRRQFP